MNIQGKKITIFGGTGFIGKSIVQQLAKEGAIINVATRNSDQAIFLKPLAEVGQITLLRINFKDPASLQSVIKGAEVVINLIGILYEKRKDTFNQVHCAYAKIIAEICQSEGVKSLIHFSSLGAEVDSDSAYAASKGRGELEVQKFFPFATIIRPSLVFGRDDHFFNKFAALASLSPLLPVFGGGKTTFQPVYVEDVTHAVLIILKNHALQGNVYELGGPEIYTFKELIKKILLFTGRSRKIISLPYWMGNILGKILEFFPHPLLTADQIKLLKKNKVVDLNSLSFKDLNIKPKSLEVIVPRYLIRFKPHF